jgi:thiol-disulfide isomerase/thioredoxin
VTTFTFRAALAATVTLSAVAFCSGVSAQQTARVTQIDAAGLKKLLDPAGRPLLINFWATWCVPCREEFPDLVKIDSDYRGRIDFITVSLDFPEDKDTLVPKFLGEMKAVMPTYLLVTPDESAAISSISRDWSGALPFTALFNEKGGLAYFRQGKIKSEILKAEIDKLIPPRSTGNN